MTKATERSTPAPSVTDDGLGDDPGNYVWSSATFLGLDPAPAAEHAAAYWVGTTYHDDNS